MKQTLTILAVLLLAGRLAWTQEKVSVKTLPPVVVKTVPESGDTKVDPALKEIRATFSKKMMTHQMWAWIQISEDTFPKVTGEIHYLEDQKTCVMPVKLEPGRTYALWLNTEKFDAFRDLGGRPAVPYLLVFETKKTAAEKGMERGTPKIHSNAGGVSARNPTGEPKPDQPLIRVAVDPRVELMSVIFRLAGNPEYNQGRVEDYLEDVEEHFGPLRNHAAIRLARELRRQNGVSFDACMSMAVHLTNVEKLEEKVPFDPRPEGLDRRWPLQKTREFLGEARKFVRESKFQEFLAAHRKLFGTAESRIKDLIMKEVHLEWFDDFFGARPQAQFTLALGMLNGGSCYGAHCRTADGKEELFCILGVWQTDDQGLPTFNQEVIETIIHEFSHSYSNSLVDRHEKELQAAGETIFPRVSSAMRRQAYGNWKTLMYESLVRACETRYVRRYQGPAAAEKSIQHHQQRGFLWMKELSDLLGEYEFQHRRYPTFESFSPAIVKFFQDYAAKDDKKQEEN